MGNATETTRIGEQLSLFACFSAPAAVKSPLRRRSTSRGLRRSASHAAQMVIDLRERTQEAEEDWADRWVSRPVVHAIVPAAQTKMPETRAAVSIFDLAYQFTAEQVISEFMVGDISQPKANSKKKTKLPAIQEQIHTRVIRDAGTVRCIRMHHTDTTEWQEREAARRARQRPPKPGTKYKTMSEKLKETI